MIDPLSLGATLYVPATRDDLAVVILQRRHVDLRSLVICLEDSVDAQDLPLAMLRLEAFLVRLGATAEGEARPLIFVRPRNRDMLVNILALRHIDRVDGFVIPKATAASLPDYLSALAFDHHMLMPTLETREVFDPSEMRRLREQLNAVHDRILTIRIGGNDLLQTIGARRSSRRTAYEGPLGPVIGMLVTTFSPWGYALSAPVFESFGDPDVLAAEVELDIDHGLFTKTAIHPAQIGVIQGGYRVDIDDHIAARAIRSKDRQSVFANKQVMCEPATHGVWADNIMRRAEIFGVRQTILSTPQSA
ncbi:MAG: HpcH/HpaI aldolase/citrate lyase family protein [Sphingomonadaceae bacterium]